MVPPFEEEGVEKYFPHFEKLAQSMGWPRVRLSSLYWRRNDFRNDFQGDLGDDKRKAVLIRGLETPFRDAAFITIFSGVELKVSKRLSG